MALTGNPLLKLLVIPVVIQAYYDALAAQRSLAASRQVAELAAQNLEAADAKYRASP